MSGEFLSITLAANETKQFQKAGRYFEVIQDGGYTANVVFYGPMGNIVSNWNGVQSGFFSDDPWGAFTLTNGASVAQTFVLMLCDTGKGGTRRQPGNVRVIDQNTDKTRAGNQFMSLQQRTALAGVYPMAGVQAGAKYLAIKRLQVSASAAGQVSLCFGTGAPTLNSGVTAGINKLFQGAGSDHQRVYGDCAGLNPTGAELPGVVGIGYILVSANSVSEVPITTPIVLPPGRVMVVIGNAVAGAVSFSADVEEVS